MTIEQLSGINAINQEINQLHKGLIRLDNVDNISQLANELYDIGREDLIGDFSKIKSSIIEALTIELAKKEKEFAAL